MRKTDTQHRLQELMVEFDVTQEDIARRTGLPKSSIHNYVKGGRDPRQDKISQISEAFGVDPAWLMGYDVPMFPRKSEELAHTDIAMLTKYMRLAPRDQKIIDQMIDSMLEGK